MKYSYSLLLFIVILMAGCTPPGNVKPSSPDQVVYAAYGTYIAVNNTSADLLDSGIITVDEMKLIQKKMLEYKPYLFKAKKLTDDKQTVPDETLNRIKLIQSILGEVLIELQKRAIK